MRKLHGALILLALSACGGGSSVSPNSPPPPPPPPPAPPGPPSSISVQQGEGQAGDPGAALPTRPAVLVKDASGRPVPSVSVTFAVDSGDGTIAGGTAVSGADGVATAGQWTLGPAEGRNVLLVSAAGVSPVRIGATGRIADVQVAQSQVGSGGGTITVSSPGSPIDGLVVTVPDGAFTTPVSISVRQSSSDGLVLPDPGQPAGVRATGSAAVTGSTPVTPKITIVTNGPPTAAGDLLLQIPVPPNKPVPIVGVIDAQGNIVAILPVVATTLTSVTVTTRTLSLTVFQQIGNIPGTIPSGNQTLTIVLFKGKGGGTSLAQMFPLPLAVNYAQGTNGFSFRDIATTAIDRIGPGMSLLEWAAYRLKKTNLQGGERASTVANSDVGGITTSAGVSKDLPGLLGRHNGAWIQNSRNAVVPSAWDIGVGSTVIFTMQYSHAPVPLTLTDGTAVHVVLVLAWQPAQERFLIRDPSAAGASYLLFPKGTMTPYQDAIAPGIHYQTAYVDPAWLSANWSWLATRVLALSAVPEFYASSFRATSVQSWNPPILRTASDKADTVFVVEDTTRLWPETASPALSYPSVLPVASGMGLEEGYLYEALGGFWSFVPTVHGTSMFLDWTAHRNGFAETVGLAVWEKAPSAPTGAAWAGWRQIELVKYGLSIDAQVKPAGTPSVFTPVFSATGPQATGNLSYEWDFGDGDFPLLSFDTSPVTHTYLASGTFPVVVKVRNAGGLVAMGRLNTSAAIIWRFDQFHVDNAGGVTAQPGGNFADFSPINNSDHVKWWVADSTLIKKLVAKPYTGLLVHLLVAQTVNGIVYRPGAYLQYDPAGTPGKAASFDPTQVLIPLGRTPGPPFTDTYLPAQLVEPYSNSFDVSPTSIDGTSIVQVKDFTGLFAHLVGAQRKRTLLAWDIEADIAANGISGSIDRTQIFWVYLGAQGVYYAGRHDYNLSFSATRVP